MAKDKLEDWDETAANNTDIGGIDLSENVMRPPAVNNAMRKHMEEVAKWLGDDTIASASTTDLGSVPGRYVSVTGTTTITALGTIKAGTVKYVKFTGALTLTHNDTSLILPGAANITTAAGDTAIFVSEGSGNWRCLAYHPAAPAINTLNGQYKFPATQNPSSNANTLDDYEEGTWTPTLTFATPGDLSVTYVERVGAYIKIGRLVMVSFTVTTSAFTHTTASGNVQITALPFTPVTTSFVFPGALQWQGITKDGYTDVVARADFNGTTLLLLASGSGVVSANVTAADMPSGGVPGFRGTVTYLAQN